MVPCHCLQNEKQHGKYKRQETIPEDQPFIFYIKIFPAQLNENTSGCQNEGIDDE